ncbi:MAG: glucose-1-phosphate thymidylyltransferase [Methanothrix sp.]|nr:MAG: glucose-1-phosphate thymidylyltransferase [Methanothrix sp.]
MQAIVLAAGEGSRMRPLTSARPKVMTPVAGAPLLEHIVTRARQAGVNKFVFVVGYRRETISEHFGDGHCFGVEIEYAFQEEQLGTGHALAVAEELAENLFLVLNGDVLVDATSLEGMIKGGNLAVAAKRVSDPTRYGTFLVEEGLLRSVVEKSQSPPSDLANAGTYLLDREVFDALSEVSLSERGEYELTDGLNVLVSRGAKIGVVELEDWIEIGRPWDVLEANRSILSVAPHGIQGEVEPNVTLSGKVSIGKGSQVRSGTYIKGPVVIGENCDIGPNCFIRSYSCIGDRVRIGNAVEIKESTIMEETNVAHLSYVGDSVIGSKSNLGAGTIVANLRHDDANVLSYVKEEKIDSGRRKLGAIMGDNVKTGINTTIYPGTVIEPGYRGRPGEVIWGHVLGPGPDEQDEG